MDNSRFEVLLPRDRRAELDALAGANGLSRSDLVRLAIGQLLDNPDEVILKFSQPGGARAA